jgi:signal transduction histidine kinase
MVVVLRLLRAVLAEPAVAGAPRRVWRDHALVGAAVIGSVLECIFRTGLWWTWPLLPVSVALYATLPMRRVHPLPVVLASFGVMCTLSIVQLVRGLDEPLGFWSMSILLVTLYSACRWASGRDALIGVAAALITGTVSVFTDADNVSDVIGGYLVLGIVIAVGAAERFRAVNKERLIDQVRSTERERLARDLHDTVAHHVSAIAIRAQAGIAVAPAKPDAAIDALHVIEAEASRTLAEMRAMVGVLRSDEAAARRPAPTLGDISSLASATTERPRVDVTIDERLGAVAPAVATALFRVAQESVTNARRHARRASRVDVHVAGEGDTVELRVSDDGDPVTSPRTPGYGIAGMEERVALLGGSCHAGPGAARGWQVIARLPREAITT